MNRLFVLVPGFGEPHSEEKLRILRNNIAYIRSGPWSSIKIVVACYDDTPIDHEGVEVVRQKGIVSDFILRLAHPDTLSEFDHILLVLDDVEFVGPHMPWEDILLLKSLSRADIISPTMTRDSKIQYEYMLSQNSNVTRVSRICEFFCYLMDTHRSYRTYYERLLDPENPWMWGADLVLHRCGGLGVGLVDDFQVRHWYKGESYQTVRDRDPHKDMERYLAKKGIDMSNGGVLLQGDLCIMALRVPPASFPDIRAKLFL